VQEGSRALENISHNSFIPKLTPRATHGFQQSPSVGRVHVDTVYNARLSNGALIKDGEKV